jgi:hypothetical protein
MPPTRKTSLEKKLANATVTPDEVYKYLTIDKGLSHEHAMGMLPNIVEESEFIYDRIQNDAKYDPDHSKGRQGIGLFQYTEPTRRKNFVEAVPDWQTNWKSQIDFALSEPETKRYLDQSFDTIEDASRYFTTDWERPRNKYRQAEKRLDYVPGLIDQIEAQNTKPYASETFQSYVMPSVNVIEKNPIKEYIDLNSDDIINDLALAGQQMNYFAQGGARNANNMKRYYATGGVDNTPVLSVRNNNPGNLRYSENLTRPGYVLEGATKGDAGFAKFNTIEEGIEAMKKQLRLDLVKRGMTLEDFLNKYAPPKENRTDIYINNIAKALDIDPDDKVSSEKIDDLVASMIIQEGGKEAIDYYKNALPQTSVRNALSSFNIDNTLDNTAQALGLPTSDDVKTQLQAYNDLKAYEELAASDPSIVVPLPNFNYDPDRSISEQYLEFNPELAEYFQGADNIPSPPSTEQPAVAAAPTEDLQTKVQAYNDLKSYDDAVAAGQADFTLANPNYDPDRPQAEQYLDANPDLKNYLQGATDPSQASASGQSPTVGAASRASGYEGMSAEELQNIYQGLLEADAAAAAAGVPPALVSGEFEEGPQAPQFLARRMQGSQEFSNLLPEVVVSAKREADFPMRKPNMLEEDAIARDAAIQAEKDDYTPMTQEEIDATIRDRALDEFIEKEVRPYQPPATRMAKPSGNYDDPDVRPKDSNFLSKLKGQDYMGLLTDIGAYAARIGPLRRALNEASSYDEERYPRFSPILPTATLPKRDVRDAFATAQQAALQQGKLDLGALSALATQQAKETARVEENVANERVGLLNQAQQLNNQITMQEMADTAANKGAAQTMKYQVLAAMSEMGQGSLREANMRRNDQIVKNMFSNVFGDEFG